MSGRRQKDTKAQWVLENLPEEFRGQLGEALAYSLNLADLKKLHEAIVAYGDRRAHEAIVAYGDRRAQEGGAK